MQLTPNMQGSFQGMAAMRQALNQMLAFAEANGARTLTLQGRVINPTLAQNLGLQVGDEFSYTVDATSQALMNLFRQAAQTR